MGKFKSEKQGLQDFFGIVFGKKSEIKGQAARMRMNIYKGGLAVSFSVIALAVLLLKFTD
jgi:hypothetical protein